MVLLLPDAPVYTIVAATPKYLQDASMQKEALIGKGLFKMFPQSPEDTDFTGERNLIASFETVVAQKKEHILPVQRYDVPNGDGSFTERYWRVSNRPVLSADGTVQYILHVAEEITHEIKAQQQEEKLKGFEQTYNLFMQLPIPVCILKGPDLIVELANEPTLDLWGKSDEVIGLPLEKAVPEMKGQGYLEMIGKVMETGITTQVYESPVTITKANQEELAYINYIYAPYYEPDKTAAAGVLAVGNNVTDKVLAKKYEQESEAKYSILFNTMDQGFCVLEMIFDSNNKATDYTFREVNPVFEQQTGLKNAMGKTIRQLVPDLESHWFELYGKVALTGEAIRFTEGSEVMGRWFDVYAFRVGSSGSKKVALLFTDITERRKVEEALKRSETNLRNMILQSPIAMAILRSPQFVVEIANDRMFELWGRGRDELLGKSIFEGLPEVKNQGYEDLLTGVYTTGTTFTASGIPVTLPREGSIETVYIDLLYEAFREGDGTISGIMAVAMDVTRQVEARREIEETVALRTSELAQANEALTRSNQELARSNVNLEEFAYAASHDLKEPIRKIHFFGNRLKETLKDRISQEEKHAFERMEGAAKRMASLIDDLLAYSQISIRPRSFEEINMNRLIDQVLEDLDLEIEDKGAVVHVDKLFTLQGHQRQLQQAFQNLIGNALKYNRAGTTPQINISCSKVQGKQTGLLLAGEEQQQTFYCITVSDNGIGFEQADAERIFNVFTRLHGLAEYKGTGIGLSIVRKVVENHNGYIVAAGAPEKGATFRIFLPADR